MFTSNEAFQIQARLLTLEFIFQSFIIDLYDRMPKERAHETLSSVKDTILNDINKMPFPNADPVGADKLRKEMLKTARQWFDGMRDRYKPET
jgi:hypothetical protein